MSVNVSARTIGSAELYERVVAALEKYELPATALELELTESALLGDATVAAENIRRFRDLGVSIAIDDFGTGYASIGYLTTMPISAVKIDRSFVDNMFSDPAAAAVVNFSLGLGQQLGLEVIAEGIEDEPTLEELRRLGCNAAQGYFISRPLGATEFLHWLLAWTTRHLTPSDVAPELDESPQSDGPAYTGSPYDLVGVAAAAPPAPSGPSSGGASLAVSSPLPAPQPFGAGSADEASALATSPAAAPTLTPAITPTITPMADDDEIPVMPQLEGLGVAAAPSGGRSLPTVVAASITTTSFDDLAPLYDRTAAPSTGPSPSTGSLLSSTADPASWTATTELPTMATSTTPGMLETPEALAPLQPMAPLDPTQRPYTSTMPSLPGTGGPLLPALPPLSLRLRGPGTSDAPAAPHPTTGPSDLTLGPPRLADPSDAPNDAPNDAPEVPS
jgi:hypothetical protein